MLDAHRREHLASITALPAARSSYFICTTARSGSTLLCEALNNTGVAGYPEEYFEVEGFSDRTVPPTLREPVWVQDRKALSFADYLARVLEYGTTSNGVFAAKLGWIHASDLMDSLGHFPELSNLPPAERMRCVFPGARYIWLSRRDKVAQAVSFARALQTDVWIQTGSQKSVGSAARMNFRLIDYWRHELIRRETAWQAFFSEAGITPLRLVYEDFVRQYDRTVRRALEYLEIPFPANAPLPAPRMSKQADSESEEWAWRYRAMDRARHRWYGVGSDPGRIRSHLLWHAYAVRGRVGAGGLACSAVRRQLVPMP